MIDAPVASRYEGILQGPKAQHFQLLCFVHFPQSSLFICSLVKAPNVYLAPPEKSCQAQEKKKQFYQNLHTNWSDIKGLTDTSALSGALEIKTSGSELRRSLLFPMCAPHPSWWAARAAYRLLCHISHIPATRVKKKKPWHIRGQHGRGLKCELTGTGDERLGGGREEKKARRSTCGGLKKNEKVSGTTAWTQRKLGERQGRSVAFPPVADYTEYTQWETGIWQPLTFSPLIIRRHIGSLQEERR